MIDRTTSNTSLLESSLVHAGAAHKQKRRIRLTGVKSGFRRIVRRVSPSRRICEAVGTAKHDGGGLPYIKRINSPKH
jgi:hypothetical protein